MQCLIVVLVIICLLCQVHEFEEVHGTDSMAYFKSSQKASKMPRHKADGEKKKSSADKPNGGIERVEEVEEKVKNTDKKAEETTLTNGSAEAADANVDEEHSENNKNNTECEKEGVANESDEMHEKIDEVATAANPEDSEMCEQTSTDADKKADEGVVTEENRTEAQEAEQTTSSDVVTMDVDNIDVPQPQDSISSVDSGECSGNQDAENKSNDVVEPMETDLADNSNGLSAEDSISRQDEQETSGEMQMETSHTSSDKDAEKLDKDDVAADKDAADEKEKVDIDSSVTEAAVKECDSQNVVAGSGVSAENKPDDTNVADAATAGGGDTVEKKTDDTIVTDVAAGGSGDSIGEKTGNSNVADIVQEVDYSGDKSQASQIATTHVARQGNMI